MVNEQESSPHSGQHLIGTSDEPSPSNQSPSLETEEVRADGELQSHELLYRLGLLLAAGIFLYEGFGGIQGRGTLGVVGSVVMSLLVVLTLATQWRVLGNWRCKTQQIVYLGTVVVLALPFLAVLKPNIPFSVIPAGAEDTVDQIARGISSVPGAEILFNTFASFLAFLIYALTLVILIAATGPNQRAGFALAAGSIIVATLLMNPNAETFMGMLFLGFFFHTQWERPLLIPPKLRQHLSPTELDYLRELVKEEALSTAETKLYLDGNPAYFQRLAEFGFVEYDSFARVVTPGKRLTEDAVTDATARALAMARRGVWIAFGLLYVVLPDFLPGPVDDMIVLAITTGAGFGWVKNIFGGGARKPTKR